MFLSCTCDLPENMKGWNTPPFQIRIFTYGSAAHRGVIDYKGKGLRIRTTLW